MKILNLTTEERSRIKLVSEKAWSDRVIKFKSTAVEKDIARFESVPALYQKRWLAAYEGTISRPGALKLKCFECVGYEDVKANIGGCQARTCPLWNSRPIK